MGSCPRGFCAGTQSVRDSYHCSHWRCAWPALYFDPWDRYGVAGFGLLAPLLIGAPLGTALGIALGVPGNRLFFWKSLGIIICTIGLTIVVEFGLMGIESVMRS